MNDSRLPDPRRDLCQELAHRLADAEGLRTARLLGQVPGLGRPSVIEPPRFKALPTEATITPEGEPSPIRIWRPRKVGEEWIFERPAPHPLGDHYSARRRFALVKAAGTRRIGFFGESAAAGYLLAPHWTPALALERRLARLVGAAEEGDPGAFEVVDLARTNERLDSLLVAVEQSLQLAPDVLVVFTGNNWNLLETPEASPFAPSVADRQAVALAWRKGGDLAVVGKTHGRLRARVEGAMAALATRARQIGAEVVLVIPEVDLATWEVLQPLAWTGVDGGAARWHRLWREALAHLDSKRFDAALAAAEAMAGIDGGCHPTSHRLRFRAYRGLGAIDAAQQAAEEAVEAAAYPRLGFLGSPQSDSRTKGWLRRAAERHGFATVDLPWLLVEEDPLPGDRYFLDYCHLSAEGIDRAMDATARVVLGTLGLEPSAVSETPVMPPAAVRALSQVGAAIHGTHRHLAVDGRGFDAERWLRRALKTEPAVLDTLVDLGEARCGPLPSVLGREQLRQLASPRPLLLQHGWRWDYLDADLLQAIFTILAEVAPAKGEGLRRRLLEHHGVGAGRRHLSRAPYLWQPLARFLPEVMEESEASRRATLRAAWSETVFALVADGRADVELDVVLRLPTVEGWAGERRGDVVFELEGVEVARLSCDEGWARHRMTIERHHFGSTLHRLTLRWPELPAADGTALDAALERLELGREADLYPVFGEVERLVASST